tara:strand:- start:4581 stop:4916 length:336 start_codon:yes stop_codon:yes gene_type:complete
MKNNFNQLVVWTGTIVGEDNAKDFENFFKEEGFKVKYVTEYLTLPDENDTTRETGGRNDVLFYVHDKDIPKFSVWRLNFGMKWWEDYLDNGSDKIVPQQVLTQYRYGWNRA